MAPRSCGRSVAAMVINAILGRWRGTAARHQASNLGAGREVAVSSDQSSAFHPLFNGSAESVVQPALGRLQRRHFAAGSLVTPERELFLVCSGTGQFVISDAHGGERIVGEIGPGDTLG